MRNRDNGALMMVATRFVWSLAWVLCIAILSFVWSLGQTVAFMEGSFPKPYDLVMGIIIQFGPQVFLYMIARTPDNELGVLGIKKNHLFWGGFWIFSGLDAVTNVGARYIKEHGLFSAQIVFGYLIDIMIVFAEELILYGVSVVSENLSDLITALGGTPPSWLSGFARTASSAGTGNRGGASRPNEGRDERPASRPASGQLRERPARPSGFPFNDE